MRIISDFKDYYDFAAAYDFDDGFRQIVYLRKTALKIFEISLESFEYIRHIGRFYAADDKIISKWWQKNASVFSLPTMPENVRSGCIFVCGKAFPFLFLRGAATIGPDGKRGQIRLSTSFNETVKDGIDRQMGRQSHERDKKYEDEFNFFKTYFSPEEFFDEVKIEESGRNFRYVHYDISLQKEVKRFFKFYSGKDFTELHLKLDCPLVLTVFHNKGRKYGGWQENVPRDYEFILNPNLNEFDFARVLSGELLVQEIEMFLGNVLVKDTMPSSSQSDYDKLTSHGFDPRTSFRKQKKN